MTHIDHSQTHKDVIVAIAITAFICMATLYIGVLGPFVGLVIPLPILFYRFKLGRSLGLLILAAVVSPKSEPLFSIDERVAMMHESLAGHEAVEIVSFDGLLVDYARERGAHVLVRGLRAFSDFEYEFQMALTNRKIEPSIETMFLMTNEAYSYISSSIVRELAALGANVRQLVPEPVAKALESKYAVTGAQ